MKTAVIGSRNLYVDDLGKYLPPETVEIVSGGAKGIDRCARGFAHCKGLKLTEFLPDYHRYGKGAPIQRNYRIVEYSDVVIAFWDGESKGTKSVIDYCYKLSKPITVFML